jgi:hypothetical protein
MERVLRPYERRKLLDAKIDELEAKGETRFWNAETETFDEYLASMGIPETVTVDDTVKQD